MTPKPDRAPGRWNLRTPRIFWVSGAGLVLALAGLWLFRTESPTFPVPIPNGYDDFLAAASRVAHSSPPTPGRTPDADPEEGRAWMLQHAETFALVRRGLGKECRVPIRPSSDWIREHAARREPRRILVYCLVARAEFARSEGRTPDMFAAYLDAYRFAQRSGQGGLFIDYIDQLGAERIVLHSLTSSVARLDPRQCGESLELIRQGMAPLENPTKVHLRTRSLARAIGGRGATVRAWGRMWQRMIRRALAQRSLAPLLMTDLRELEAIRDAHQKLIDAVGYRLRRIQASWPAPADK